MADRDDDERLTQSPYERRKVAELQGLIDLIDYQSADTSDEGTRTKLAELRGRILTLSHEYDESKN